MIVTSDRVADQLPGHLNGILYHCINLVKAEVASIAYIQAGDIISPVFV